MSDSDYEDDFNDDSSDGSFVDYGRLRDDDDTLYSTVDELGYPDMTILESYVDVLNIKSIPDAIAYVNAALAEATDEEYDRLRDAVIGEPTVPRLPRPRRPVQAPLNKQDGGFDIGAVSDIDLTDRWIARLFELADAIHDLDRENDHSMRKFLEESIGAKLPEGMTIADVKNKTRFIKYMTTANDLVFKFKDGAVHKVSPNPMKGRNLEGSALRIHKGDTCVVRYINAYPASVDMCFKRGSASSRVSVLKDMVSLREVMDKSFGFAKHRYALDMCSDLDVMIDQDMHPDTRRAHCHLVAWMLGFKNLLSTTLFKFEKADGRELTIEDEAKIKATTALRFVYCDATLLDGGRTKGMDHSDRVTGNVYHKNSEIRFEFVGPNGPDQYGYKAWSTVPQYNPIDENDKDQDHVHRVITGCLYRDMVTQRRDQEPSTDKERVFKQVKTWKDENVGHVAYLAARVRAGDWGQIEHCKKNKVVFITADRLSAMYATYRGVGVILVRHDDQIQQSASGTYAHYRFCFGLPRLPLRRPRRPGAARPHRSCTQRSRQSL